MNRYVFIGIIGVISGILCARADVPLAWSGRKGEAPDPGAVGHISPWWTEVRERHFDLAFWLSCIGQPGTYLTAWMLAKLISARSAVLGTMLKICTFVGTYTGLLFHAVACIKPLVYRAVAKEVTPETAQRAMNAVDKYPRIPSLVSGIVLFLIETVLVMLAIVQNALDVPKWFVLLNPVGALPILLIARRLHLKIGGAMGIGFALFGIVLITAGMQL